MNLNQNQADHFNQGLENIGKGLLKINKKKEIIEQAKHDLLDLFLDNNAGLNTHEDVNKAFAHVKQLLENKIQQTDNEDQKQAFSKLKSSIQRSQRTYNNPNTFINKQEVSNRTKQIKELYDKITKTTTPSESLDIEDKKADTGKEELKQFGTSEKETPKYNIKVLLDPEAKVRGDKQTYVSRELMELAYNNDKGNNPKHGGSGQTLDRIIERGGYTKTELSKLLKPEIDKINTKYDTELKTLENKGTYQEKEEATSNIQSKNEQVTTNKEDKTTPEQVELTPIQQEGIGGFVTDTSDTTQVEKEKSPQDNTTGEPEEKASEEKDYINELLEKIKFLKELNYLAARCDKTLNSDTGEIQKIREQYNTLLDKNINYTQDPQNKTDLEIQRQKDFIEKKLNDINTTENIQEHTKKEIHDLFTIDANVMDKENLIEESERNRIKDLSERKYMEANWLQKVGMFGIDRRRQNKKLKKSMDSQRNSSNFIEQGNLQDRIDGNIGTYAQQNKMGIDGGNITRSKESIEDNQINSIAHDFLMGTITKELAISKFNEAFNRNPRLRMGNMTGTDIMAQLENAEFKKTYKIKQLLFPFIDNKKVKLSDTDIVSIQQQLNTNKVNIIGDSIQTQTTISADEITSSFEQLKADMLTNNINQLTENTTRIRVKLRGLTKRPETEELEGVRYDRFYKQGKLSKVLERGGILLNIGLKAATGIALSGTGPLGVFLGITALGSALQLNKSGCDAIKEIAKTQEDAINMGVEEFEKNRTILKKALTSAKRRNKYVFKHFGMGSYHRSLKQLKILDSFQQMKANDNTMVSVDKVINNLKTTTTDIRPLADALARIHAGQHYQAHFVSTTDANGKSLGREQTAIKHHEMINELEEACFRTQLIERRKNITKTEWQQVRSKIATTPHYQKTIKELSTTYEQVEKDIMKNKNSIARNAAGNYVKTVAATSAGAVIVGGIIHGFNGSNTGQDIAKEIKPHEHTNYKLGKFDDNGIINNTNTSGLDQVHNGQTIEIQGESAVDAVKAHSSNSFGNYMDHVKETRELVSHSGLNKATQETLQNAISDQKIEEIMNIAKDAGADEGNRRLVVERWREGMENITEYLSKHNMKDVTIKDIVFDTDTAKMAMQSSTGGADVTHRGFEAMVKVVEQKTNEVKEIPRSFPWEPGVLAALPFANTYALPGQKADFASLNPQVVEQKRKRYELRKKQETLQTNRWENKYAA